MSGLLRLLLLLASEYNFQCYRRHQQAFFGNYVSLRYPYESLRRQVPIICLHCSFGAMSALWCRIYVQVLVHVHVHVHVHMTMSK